MREDASALLQACLGGDPEAWRTFVDRYARLILFVIRRTSGAHGVRLTEEQAEDLCADVFYGLVRDGAARLRAYNPAYSLATYLGAIARSATVDHVRKARAAARAEPRAEAGAPAEDPAEAVGREEAARALEAVLADLSPRERLVVELYYFSGKKYREIAEILGAPLNTVCSTLSRALAKLRERLPPLG